MNSEREPDSETLLTARLALESAIGREASVVVRGSDHHRWWRLRPRWLAAPAVIATSIVIVVTLVGPAPNTDLGMQVSFANTPPEGARPHLLSQAVSIGYLPPGFTLVSDSVANSVSRPVAFSHDIQFSSTTGEGRQRLFALIQQSPHVRPELGQSGPYQTVTPTTIGGHPGAIVVATPPPPSSGPADACGPPAPVTASELTAPSAVVRWQEGPDVTISVQGAGVPLDQLFRVASGLVDNPSVGDCLAGARIISRQGPCAPGTTGSPASGSPTIPPGGQEIASGTADGQPWILSASIGADDPWYQLNWRGTPIGSSLCDGGSLINTFDVDTFFSGQLFGNQIRAGRATARRIAFGAIATWVDSVQATSGGTAVSQAAPGGSTA